MDLSSGGQLPLHLAAAAGSAEVLTLLLAAGTDVEAKNGSRETALQVNGWVWRIVWGCMPAPLQPCTGCRAALHMHAAGGSWPGLLEYLGAYNALE
jgi:hypothetical protein